MNGTQKYKTDIPVAKIFIYSGDYYLYDTYNNHLLQISKEHYIELSILFKQGINEYLCSCRRTQPYKDIVSLMYRGYLRKPWIEHIEHPETLIVESIISRGMQHLTLQVTQDCNFKCRYCHYTRDTSIERTHNKTQMDWEVAKKSIDFMWEHSKDSSQICFGFYGGEPLLNFNLIRECTEYIEKKFETKNISCNITTNGSVLTNEIIKYMAEKNFTVSVSLDGPPHIQNYNRKFYENGKDTFDVVWNNVQRMKEVNLEWFNKKVYFHPVYLAHENATEIMKFYSTNSISPKKVLLYRANLDGIDYISINTEVQLPNEKNEIANPIFRDFEKQFKSKSIINNRWHHNGPCVPGGRKIFVDVNGNIFPCEKLNSSMANSIGDIDNGINIDIVKKLMNIGKMTEAQCKRCFAMRFCSICVQKCYNPEKGCIDLEQKEEQCNKIKNKAINQLKQYIERNKK